MLRTALFNRLKPSLLQKTSIARQPSIRVRFSSHSTPKNKKTTIQSIRSLYKKNIPISVLTAYDFPSASIVDKAGIDVCLVGDSLAMTVLGHQDTNEITLDEMIHHSKAVSKGCISPFVIGDLPMGSFESGPDQALQSAIQYVKKGRVEAVKLEGGIEMTPQVQKITSCGIPVMGHIGLTPQRQSSFGGFRVQGKTVEKAKRMLDDALALQEAGAFIIVLEAVPSQVAQFITQRLHIPTIGIGAGPYTSGQVLVYLDTLAMFDRFMPRFCKVYGDIGRSSVTALEEYKKDVVDRKFPDLDLHCYGMASKEEEEKFKQFVLEYERLERIS